VGGHGGAPALLKKETKQLPGSEVRGGDGHGRNHNSSLYT